MNDIFDYDGGDTFGCEYCSGVGFTDYPSNQHPCPIPGHAKRALKNFENVGNALREMHKNDKPWPSAICPYCGAKGEVCRHWTGLGWSRDR